MNLVTTSSLFTCLYLAMTLEGILYGLYSGIFVVYLRYHTSIEGTKNMLQFYALVVLYALSTAIFGLDIAGFLIDPNVLNGDVVNSLYIVGNTLFGCCDFIAQSILIYRCWIVWDQNLRVVVIPAILAIAFLAIWIAATTGDFLEHGQIPVNDWSPRLMITGTIISMTVNALVTSLIVFKIFRVFRKVKVTSNKGVLNDTGGAKFRSIIFIIIESGMVLFFIQLVRWVVSTEITDAALDAFELSASILQMFNGIAPTIILVRVSMGLSFHDETSMVEAGESVLRFAPDGPNPNPETESNIQDGSLHFVPDHLSPIAGMESINQERINDGIGGNEDF